MEENFFRNFNELTFFYYMLLGDRSDSTSRYVNCNVKNSPKFLNNLNIFHIVELHLFLGVGNKIFKTLDDKMKGKKYLKLTNGPTSHPGVLLVKNSSVETSMGLC